MSYARKSIDALAEGWSGSSTTNYWMDAAGKATQVDSHAEGAYEILGVEKFGQSPYHAMFEKGYCRIVIDRYADAIYVEKTTALTKEQRSKLEDWCIERQMPLIRTDLYGPSEKVIFNPPLPPMKESLPGPEEPDMDFYCGWVKTSGEVSNVSGADNKDDNGHRDMPDELLDHSVPHDGSVYNPWRYRGDLQEVFFWYPATNTQKEAVKKWLKTKSCPVKYFDTIYSKVGQKVGSMDSRSMRVHDIAHGAPSYRQRIGDSVEEGWTGSGVTNYWLNRAGQLIKVQGHLLGAINLLHLSAPPEDGSEGAAYEMMFNAGYVRVVVEHDNYSIEVDAGDRGLNRAQTDTLKDLAIERHARLVLTTFPAEGGRITKTIYDPNEMSESEEPIATFLGVQPGMGVMPDIELWNLTRDIPGHPKGSTVSRETLEKAGYRLPPAPKQEAVTGRPEKWYRTAGNPDKEHIISAGIMLDNGDLFLGDGHAEARVEAGFEASGRVVGRCPYTEGFYTSKGRFVSREEAMKVAKKANQFPPKLVNNTKIKDLGSCSEDYRLLSESEEDVTLSYRDWRKIAIGGNAKMNRYWQDKSGKLTHVISHESGAVKLRPDLFPAEMFPRGVASTPGAGEQIYDAMYKEGYARVTSDLWDPPGQVYVQRGRGSAVGKTWTLTNAQTRVLKDLAVELGTSLILDANGKTTYLYEPEQELPEAVKYAYHATLAERRASCRATVRQLEEEALQELGEATVPGVESVATAAIKLSNGTVVTGGTHWDCIQAAREQGSLVGDDISFEDPSEVEVGGNDFVSGFVTSTGRFVSRNEAFKIARQAGQVTTKHRRAYGLASEVLPGGLLRDELPEAFEPEEPDTPFKKRLGRCYEIAGRAALNNPGVTLVHGSIQKDPNPRIGHAWCEIPSQLPPEVQEKLRKEGFEPEPEIYEPTSNNVYPKDFFMAYHNAKEDQRYAPDEMRKKILQAKHWGPWGEASGVYGPMKGSRKRKKA